MEEPAPQTAPSRILSLLFGMGFQPRRTIRWIVAERGARGTLALVLALSLIRTVVSIPRESYSAAMSAWGGWGALGVMIALLLFVAALVVAGYFAISGLTLLSGRWLGGKATWTSIRAALAWGLAPLYWGLLIRIPAAIFWPDAHSALNSDRAVRIGGEMVRMRGFTDASPFQVAILAGLEFLVFAWLLVILSRSLGEVQEFSGWEGFANLVIALVLPVTAIVVVVVAAALAF
ncbi:MAG: YIP1 family protein [Thermoanaerobaculia bacterium]